MFNFKWENGYSFLASGYLGVDIFFLLSGFILSHVYHDDFKLDFRQRYKNFMISRIARIYPVHAFILVFYIAYLTVAQLAGFKNDPVRFDEYVELLKQLFLIHAWGFSDYLNWNVPSWSISVELFAYLLFPFLIVEFRQDKLMWRLVRLLLSFIGLGLLCYYRKGLNFSLDYGLVRIFFEFNIGCALYGIAKSDVISIRTWNWVFNLSIAALIIYFLFDVPPIYEALFEVIITVFICGLFKGKGTIQKVLGSQIMFYLGEISFSIYMSHWLVFRMFANISDRLPSIFNDTFAAVTTVIILTLIISHLLYTYVEMPGRKYIRKYKYS